MQNIKYQLSENKVIIRLNGKICQTGEELILSKLFYEILEKCIKKLEKKNSILLSSFSKKNLNKEDIELLVKGLKLLLELPINQVKEEIKGFNKLLENDEVFNNFIEYLYNYWRSFERFIIYERNLEKNDIVTKPHRIFNNTIEKLTHLIRYVYRNIQENITGTYPRIYRQVRAGAEIAAIVKSKKILVPEDDIYTRLNNIPVIRQVLLYPPLVLNPPMNKRSGEFIKIDMNPLELVDIDSGEWLCYPAKVGKLNILIYFHNKFFELGFSLCNLFELSSGKDLECKPDGLYLFGVEENSLDRFGANPAVFYDDLTNDILIAAVPRRDDFGYFGYLKKMILTLHNIKMIKSGNFPFHGALVQLNFRTGQQKALLIIGDTGAGKSELIEAFRIIGKDDISDIIVIADDMGSLKIGKDKNINGYSTEIGAFLRLDDLQQGYAFGQMDRSIFMNPSLINARLVLPLTSFENIIKGIKIDYFLYANNYEQVDMEHPIIEKIENCEDAIRLFSEGAVMSKGTTTSTGLIHSYYANIFGPPQYRELHDKLAIKYFKTFYKNKVFVGQIRTRLGVTGFEKEGPKEAAKELLKIL